MKDKRRSAFAWTTGTLLLLCSLALYLAYHGRNWSYLHNVVEMLRDLSYGIRLALGA